jgi:hypothetical protein
MTLDKFEPCLAGQMHRPDDVDLRPHRRSFVRARIDLKSVGESNRFGGGGRSSENFTLAQQPAAAPQEPGGANKSALPPSWEPPQRKMIVGKFYTHLSMDHQQSAPLPDREDE